VLQEVQGFPRGIISLCLVLNRRGCEEIVGAVMTFRPLKGAACGLSSTQKLMGNLLGAESFASPAVCVHGFVFWLSKIDGARLDGI